MAIDAYMWFMDYQGKYLPSESQVDFSSEPNKAINFPPPGNVFEIQSYSFDIEQTLNIGSQSSGAGAGKITFNPFSITRAIDKSSPTLFQMACSGTSFQFVTLILRKAAGGPTGGAVYMRYTFKLVAVKTISTSLSGGDTPLENVTFEYGGLTVEYWPQNATGTLGTLVAGGWNRVMNIADQNPTTKIG